MFRVALASKALRGAVRHSRPSCMTLRQNNTALVASSWKSRTFITSTRSLQEANKSTGTPDMTEAAMWDKKFSHLDDGPKDIVLPPVRKAYLDNADYVDIFPEDQAMERQKWLRRMLVLAERGERPSMDFYRGLFEMLMRQDDRIAVHLAYRQLKSQGDTPPSDFAKQIEDYLEDATRRAMFS
eukprot:Clim_evm81s225 gene=Clim_evmTU81s225